MLSFPLKHVIRSYSGFTAHFCSQAGVSTEKEQPDWQCFPLQLALHNAGLSPRGCVAFKTKKTSAGVSDQICDGEKQMLFYVQKQTNVILHNESLETSFPAISWTWSHRYYLNWTELDDAITEFNNEMHSADNWVLNCHFTLLTHYFPILILCSALLQFVLLKAL